MWLAALALLLPHLAKPVVMDDTAYVLRARQLRVPEGAVERVAVLASERGLGTGRALMHAIEAEVLARGLGEVVLNAQADVVEFYERLGYSIEDRASLGKILE